MGPEDADRMTNSLITLLQHPKPIFTLLQVLAETPYCKILKYSDTWKIAVIILKLEQCGSTTVMSPKDADEMANSVEPDQTIPPLWAVWSGSTMFSPGLSVWKLRIIMGLWSPADLEQV